MAGKRRSRKAVTPTLGALLVQLRGRASRGAICTRLPQYGLSLNRSTLLQYERGTVLAPDPAILWGLSKVHHVKFDDLMEALLRDRIPSHAPFRSAAPVVDPTHRVFIAFLEQADQETGDAVRTLLKKLLERREPTGRRHRTHDTGQLPIAGDRSER